MPATNTWLSCPRPNPRAGLRLFCFPYAGGSAALFRGWADGLPADVELCAVELPGHGRRLGEAPFTRVGPLVEAAAEALLPHLDRPFGFFGHSMGAKCSFELARLLRGRHGREPARLFVSGCRAPQLRHARPPTYGLPEPEFIAELRRLNGTPAEVLEHAELLELMLPLLRADFEVVQTYEYTEQPPLGCPVNAFGGFEDEDVSLQDLEGWGEQTTASFEVRMLPGDHFFLHTSRPLLLQALSEDLRRLEAGL